VLTRKTTYGIRALASLARSREASLSVAELSARESIPEHFLSAILSDLRQRGIVRGRRGPDGGYQLAVDPRRLNLAEVVESLGGPIFPFSCLEPGSGDHPRCSECPGENRCVAEKALRRASTAAYESLESITILDLIAEHLDSEHEPATDPGSRSELRQKRAELSRPALTPLRTKRQQP
jgi:Rrf2 family protein